MPITHIPQQKLNAAVRLAEKVAATAAPKTEMRGGDGVLLRRVPTSLYLNATSVHGHSPADEEYWRDMERLCPAIKVPYTPRKLTFRMGNTPSLDDGFGKSKLTRFGRVTFHKNYGPGERR